MSRFAARPSLILFFKAIQNALFEAVVPIKGHATKHGTFVAPHMGKRRKRLNPPAPAPEKPRQPDDLFTQPERATQQPDLFSQPAAAPKKPEPPAAAAQIDLFAQRAPASASTPATKPATPSRPPAIDLFANLPPDAAPVKPATTSAQKPEEPQTPADVARQAEAVVDAAQNTFGVRPGINKAERRKINAQCLDLLTNPPETYSAADKALLRQYSGNGGCGDSLNEFYTSPEIAAAMWSLLDHHGFTGGNVLEPSCATGVFLHTAPAKARVTGVELDPTSAKIAGILHGERAIFNTSLEMFATQGGHKFSAVIGNCPFGLRGDLIKYDKPSITTAEEYFLDTALDQCEDQGLVAIIVPTGIMDASSKRGFRERILRKGEFLGAHRLPNTAFSHSHTGVTSDIVIFRKRPQDVAGALATVSQDTLKTLNLWDEDFLSGDYFTTGRGKDTLYGTLEAGWRAKAGMGNDITVSGSMAGVAEKLAEYRPADTGGHSPDMPTILNALGDNEIAKARAVRGALKTPYLTAKVGDTRIINGVTYVLNGYPPRWHRAMDDSAPFIMQAKEISRQIELLAESPDPANRQQLQDDLDEWIKENGNPGKNRELKRAAAIDKSLWRIIGAVNADGSYSDLITGEKRSTDIASIETRALQFALSREEFNVGALASAIDWNNPDTEEYLYASANFAITPDGQWQTRDRYLSGELWPKLDAINAKINAGSLKPEQAAKWRQQAEWLEQTIDPQSLENIEITLASGFIKPTQIEAWLNAQRQEWLDKHPQAKWTPDVAEVSFDGALWTISGGLSMGGGLLQKYLNHSGVKEDDVPTIERMNSQFVTWLLASDHRETVENTYNRTYRGFVPVHYSDEPIAIPGLNPALDVNRYHFEGLRWAMETGKGIVAADVGLGKTGRALMLARLLKTQGSAKKPMIVVPKSVLANWIKEAETWFPGSKIMVIGETVGQDKKGNTTSKSDNEETRRTKYHQLSQNDYDFVFISQPAWNDLDVNPIAKGEYVNDDFWVKRGDALGNTGDKRLNQIRTAYDQAIAQREHKKRDDTIYFDNLGVDCVILDEGHCFPAGTLIDGKPIETYQAGDQVRAFDHVTGQIVLGRVANLQMRTPRDLYRITLEDGTAITCTGNHPFFTEHGYIFAKDIFIGDNLYKATDRNENGKNQRFAVENRCAATGDGSHHEPGTRTSESLQNRHCSPETNDCNRSGRKIAPIAYPEGPGPEEGRFFEKIRVASIQVFEPTSDGTFNGLCPGGFVYNIEVEIYHNYLVEGILVHNCFKNLYAVRNRFGESPKYLGGSGLSNRAQDTYFKTRWIREQNKGKGVFMLTATPTKNSPLEIYSMLSHIAPEAFMAMGIKNSEEFLDRFCVFQRQLALDINGAVGDFLCTVGFKNMDELREVMRRYIDRKTAADVGLKLPERDDQQHLVAMTAEQEEEYSRLRLLAKASDGNATGEAHIFSIMDKMQKAALDMALLGYQGQVSPKMDSAAKHIMEGISDGGQVVFIDSNDCHERMAERLVKQGIPRNQIGIINAKTAPTSDKRQKISDDFNSGKLKVVIGNTATMGEGINLQKGTTDIHHLDLPWEPASMQQRNGRGLRQGNLKKSVRIHSYLAKGSFDGYRYQTLNAKKDWQDLLWHGGDRIENLAMAGASREEMLILLSADPDQARKKYESDKDAARQRLEADQRATAREVFVKFQQMCQSYEKLKAGGAKGESVVRLQIKVDQFKQKLKDHPGLPNNVKNTLDQMNISALDQADRVWKTGDAFLHPGGDAGGKTLSGGPSTWIITGINPAQQTVTARRYGQLNEDRMTFAVPEMHNGLTPTVYDEKKEANEIAQKAITANWKTLKTSLHSLFNRLPTATTSEINTMWNAGLDAIQQTNDTLPDWHQKDSSRADMHEALTRALTNAAPLSSRHSIVLDTITDIMYRTALFNNAGLPNPIKNPADLLGVDDSLLNEYKDDLQAHFLHNISNYSDKWDSEYPIMENGKLSLARSWQRERFKEKRNIMLPTTENREKALDAYVAMQMTRHIVDRWETKGGSTKIVGKRTQFESDGMYEYNPWETIGRKLWGDSFGIDAKRAYYEAANQNITTALQGQGTDDERWERALKAASGISTSYDPIQWDSNALKLLWHHAISAGLGTEQRFTSLLKKATENKDHAAARDLIYEATSQRIIPPEEGLYRLLNLAREFRPAQWVESVYNYDDEHLAQMRAYAKQHDLLNIPMDDIIKPHNWTPSALRGQRLAGMTVGEALTAWNPRT